MARGDLLDTIEVIHAAGLDRELWPQALGAVARLVGGAAATLEVLEKPSLRPLEIYCHGVPPADEIRYLDQYAALNRRLPIAAKLPLGDVHWDWRLFDEATIRRDPFHMEFLASLGLRYFVGGIIATDGQQFTGLCVHRTPKQGHVGDAGVASMRRLLPHVQQAFDVARRLKSAGETRDVLECTLDCLADGVALLRADGTVTYANESLRAIAGRNDGIRLGKGAIEFNDPAARDKLNAAVASTLRLKRGEAGRTSAEFAAGRATGRRPYLISVRSLPSKPAAGAVVAIIFVRDPLSHGTAATGLLREMFGLTNAEAALAQALQSGVTLADYAHARSLSLNTVYTHLRRLREKTGCSRVAELIHKLNELRLPLRTD